MNISADYEAVNLLKRDKFGDGVFSIFERYEREAVIDLDFCASVSYETVVHESIGYEYGLEILYLDDLQDHSEVEFHDKLTLYFIKFRMKDGSVVRILYHDAESRREYFQELLLESKLTSMS